MAAQFREERVIDRVLMEGLFERFMVVVFRVVIWKGSWFVELHANIY